MGARTQKTPPINFGSQTALTIVTRNHFHYALALSDNLRQVDPNANLIIVVADLNLPNADRPDWDWLHPTDSAWSQCHNQFVDGRMILSGDDACDADFAKMAFQYTAFELTCALKSQAAYLLLEAGVEEVTYLDADVRLSQPLSALTAELDSSDSEGQMLLTPHVRSRLPDDGNYPNNIDLLRTGNFNAGIWAFKQGKESNEELTGLLCWWRDCCRFQCIVDPHDGLFVDQKWLDQAVSISSSVVVSRDPGINVGYWNLHEFNLEESFPQLIAFHFSGVPEEELRLSKHQNRHRIIRGSKLADLVSEYQLALRTNQANHYQALEYLFDKTAGGLVIQAHWREAIRTKLNPRETSEDPFQLYDQESGPAQLDQLSETIDGGRFDWQQAQLHRKIQTLRDKLDRQPLRWLAKKLKQKLRRSA